MIPEKKGEIGQSGDKSPHSKFMRRGLAPVEFVLWLPVLLFIMALMVNYGTSAAWRVRGEIVSRDAVWRDRWPRYVVGEGPPDQKIWPRNATMNVVADAQLSVLDDPSINVPVVRGPLPNGFGVRQILNPQQGAEKGTASIQRRYPMLPALGSFESGEIANPLIDGMWSNRTMGIPYVQRRIPVLYQLPWPDKSAFLSAAAAASNVPDRNALSLIDRSFYDPNDHWWYYRNGCYQAWRYLPVRYHSSGKGDFIPRIGRDCTLDVNRVYTRQVQRLVDVQLPTGKWRLGEISRLPRRLTGAYLGMFNQTKNRMEQLLNLPMTDPNAPSPAERAFIESELPTVETYIDQLNRFQGQIATFENQMQNR